MTSMLCFVELETQESPFGVWLVFGVVTAEGTVWTLAETPAVKSVISAHHLISNRHAEIHRQQSHNGEIMHIMANDVARAYFNAPSTSLVFVKLLRRGQETRGRGNVW